MCLYHNEAEFKKFKSSLRKRAYDKRIVYKVVQHDYRPLIRSSSKLRYTPGTVVYAEPITNVADVFSRIRKCGEYGAGGIHVYLRKPNRSPKVIKLAVDPDDLIAVGSDGSDNITAMFTKVKVIGNAF